MDKAMRTTYFPYTAKTVVLTYTPPVYIEYHTMHFTPVLNLWCHFNTQWCYSNTFGCYFNTLWCYVQTLGCNFNTWGCGPLLTPTGLGVILTSQFLQCKVATTTASGIVPGTLWLRVHDLIHWAMTASVNAS